MNWIQENKLLAAIAGVALVLVLALGWVAFDGYAKAGKAKKAYATASASLSGLYAKKLYPNEPNLTAKAEAVKQLESETGNLRETLAKAFSAPEGKDPATFGQRVQSQYQELRKVWDECKMAVPDNFFLGLDDYRRQVAARPAAVRDLDYQLAAISEVLETAARCGVKSVDAFERTPVLEEKGAVTSVADTRKKGEPPAEPPLVRYGMTLRCTGSEKAVRDFVNALAVSQKHFYAFRVVRFQNEKKVGPKKEDVRKQVKPAESPAGGVGGLFGDFGAGPAPAAAPLTDAARMAAGMPAGGEAAGEPKPGEPQKPVFAKPGAKDAYEFLGNESIKAYLKLDLVVFRPAPEVAEKGKAQD